MFPKSNSPARSLAVSIAILVAVWLLGFTAVQLSARGTSEWLGEAGQLIAAVLGIIAASKLQARLAFLLLVAFAVFAFAELSIHVAFGVRALRGGPANLAVVIATLGGLAVGAVLLRRSAQAPLAPRAS